MKIGRLISFITLGVLALLLILGNIFYLDVRKVADKNHVPIEIDESEMNRIDRLKNPDYNLYISTDKYVYSKFEKIKIIAQIFKKGNTNVLENSVIEVEFFNNGQKIRSLAGSGKTRLNYNADQKMWVGYWYPENSDITGNFEITASGYLDNPESPVREKTSFYITEITPKYKLKKGIAFIGIDSLERISKRNILSADANEVDWNGIPEWLNFISADGILMLAGVTKTFDESLSMESPWDNDKVNESMVLADRIKQRGKNFGVWMNALKVEGIYAKKMGYRTTLTHDNDKYTEEPSVISLLDENRKKNITRLFTTYMENDNISYVGISEIFLEPAQGLELMENFIKELQIDVPENWQNLDFDGKFRYFSDRIRNKELFDQFVTWKQYHISQYLKDIISSTAHHKPVFYFVDYEEAIANPDLISIVLNSGVDFIVMNFNMPYDKILENMETLSKISKISGYFNRVIISYYIDYKNTDMPGSEVSAIENYVYANLQLTKYGSDTLNANGIMINDLYKAMFGKRGPYSPYEWMLGIGETIYQFKNINKYIPLDINCYAPQNVTYGEAFRLRFNIINTSPKAVENFKIDFLPSFPGKPIQKNNTISSIPAGKEIELNVDMLTETNQSQFVRKKSYVGIRVSWLENNRLGGSTANSFVLFKAMNLSQPETQTTNTNK